MQFIILRARHENPKSTIAPYFLGRHQVGDQKCQTWKTETINQNIHLKIAHVQSILSSGCKTNEVYIMLPQCHTKPNLTRPDLTYYSTLFQHSHTTRIIFLHRLSLACCTDLPKIHDRFQVLIVYKVSVIFC